MRTRAIFWHSCLEAARFGVRLFQSLCNLTGTSTTGLPRCLSNFRAMRSVYYSTSRFRDFAILGGKTSYRLVNRSPGLSYTRFLFQSVIYEVSSTFHWMIKLQKKRNFGAKLSITVYAACQTYVFANFAKMVPVFLKIGFTDIATGMYQMWLLPGPDLPTKLTVFPVST